VIPIPSLEEAVRRAYSELEWASLEDIQGATAMTWAGRAIVSYERYRRSRSSQDLSDASEYHHEALEHAAGAAPGVLEALRDPLTNAARAAGVER
jgi:hypothetical protein